MAKIISMQEKRLLKSARQNGDISDSLAHMLQLARDNQENEEEGLLQYANLKAWFEKRISNEIIKRRKVSSDVFLCGIYTAGILGEASCNLEKYTIDFIDQWLETSDPKHLKDGADFCFILCGGFSKRCSRRMMKLADYQELGAGFYDRFYCSTGKTIGHYMSLNFNLMQEIVNTVFFQKAQCAV